MPPTENAAVAIYRTHMDAEEAIKELQRYGCNLKKLSIAGREYRGEEHVAGCYSTGDRMRYLGKTGAFWGSLRGQLPGSGFFTIPGIGPILVAGPLVAWIVGAAEGDVPAVGLSAFGAGLYRIGIPKDGVFRYETALRAGKFLLLAHGDADEVAKAKEILETTRPYELDFHSEKTSRPDKIGVHSAQPEETVVAGYYLG